MKNSIKTIAVASLILAATGAMAAEQCVNSTHVADGVWASQSVIKHDLKLDLLSVGTTPVVPQPTADPNYSNKYDCGYKISLRFAQDFPTSTLPLLQELVHKVHYAAVPGDAWSASCDADGTCQLNFRKNK